MKHTHIFILFLLGLSLHAQAQKVLRLQAGISRGILNHEFTSDGYIEKRYSAPLSGYALGLGLQYLDKGLFSMSSDLHLYQSGGRDNNGSDKENNIFQAPSRLRTTYLSAATTADIHPLRGAFRLRIGVGPRVDWLLTSNDKAPFSWYRDLELKGVARVNVGINGVLGLYWRTSSVEYGLTGTWVYRFLPLLDIDGGRQGQFQYGGADSREQTVLACFTVGYIF